MTTASEFNEYFGSSPSVKLAIYELMMATAPVGVWYTNEVGEVIYVSQGVQKILHRDKDELYGDAHLDYIHPDDIKAVKAVLNNAISTKSEFSTHYRYRTGNGEWCWVHVRGVWNEKHNGFPAGLIGILLDVTEVYTHQHEAHMLRHCVEQVKQPVVVTDATKHDNPIIYVNHAFSKLTGYTFEEVEGRNPRILHGVEKDQPEIAMLREHIDQERPVNGLVIRNYTKYGESYLTELYISPVYHHDLLTYWVGVQVEVTEKVRKREIEELKAVVDRLSEISSNCRSISVGD